MTQNQVALIPNLTAGSSLISVLTSNTALTLYLPYEHGDFNKVELGVLTLSNTVNTVSISRLASATETLQTLWNIIANVAVNQNLALGLGVSHNLLGDPIIFYSNATGSPIIFYASATGNPINFYRSPISGLERFIQKRLKMTSSFNHDKREQQPDAIPAFVASTTAGALVNKTSNNAQTIGITYTYTVS